MKLLTFFQPLTDILAHSRSCAAGASLIAALVFTACGGGGGVGGSTDTGLAAPAASAANSELVSEGVISGFGSIIVNSVRFDDSKAKIEDAEDEDNPLRNKDDLRLGMVVTVTGSSVTNTGTAAGTGTASIVSFGSQLKGPVQSIDGAATVTATATVAAGSSTTSTTAASSHTLVILGQTVEIGAWTVFDPLSLPTGFSSIATGNVLEVHGHLAPALNRMIATRISKENNTTVYKITGNVSSLDTASKSFKIGAENFSYANTAADKMRVALVNGLTVKVRLTRVQATTGTWTVTRINPAKKLMQERVKAEVEGVITAFTSATAFSVNGLVVDATNASFRQGTATLALGVRVEVKGTVVDGKLVAVSVKTEGRERSTDDGNVIELHGKISALNTTTQTFTLRGLTVIYTGNVSFQRGSSASLVNGVEVEVKGQAAGGGTTVQATRIKFED